MNEKPIISIQHLINENGKLSKQVQTLKAELAVQRGVVIGYRFQSPFFLRWVVDNTPLGNTKLVDLSERQKQYWKDLDLYLLEKK